MTEKQFFASKWKPFEVMTVYIEAFDKFCECYLIGIEFEDRIMKVRPLDVDLYEDDIFDIPIDVITRGKDKSKLRIVV